MHPKYKLFVAMVCFAVCASLLLWLFGQGI